MDTPATVQMLNLKLPTDPRWVNLAEMDLEEILTDHAYCEQKATTSCISLVQGYSDYPEIVAQVSPVVTEEWGHFRMVLRELDRRGLKLGRQRKDEYVNGLMKFMKRSEGRDKALLEKLLLCALIEARSCERFRLLSLYCADVDLREFYHKFMVAEAGHYVLFIDLARKFFDRDLVDARWAEWLSFEKDMLANMEVRGDRMH
ncbi:tRNA-(ms[2]io[6]A)-hydroxylase [Neolewinella antarctica]|uniref:tRNA-(Ms[2]io[6]A)-hydroxylase n=1 Tax=Neolewinella antarctica TaxID=442734 RepID=A0ABX0X6B5_9BACT|nr:tRNA-(ms[2]io[6]A)-hydroxylase [Neolewinella antarctica]NJC24743.1 tRNA-(ms[2]io[6]A)-hydroxylase [Neolewinella antarctica]